MPESDRPQHTNGLLALTVVCAVGIFTIMPFAQGVVGILYMNDCPRQPFIPIYLLLIGVCSIIERWCLNKCNTLLYRVFSFFVFIWFIAGNVGIYSIYEPNYNKNTTQVSPYCNKTLYLFAFWTNNLTYILLGVLFLSWCCCTHEEPDDEAQRPLQRYVVIHTRSSVPNPN
ncbi:transmembrane protein 272-like [Micropterus salmoides]|uniref:transmembrane protein 272-like n=1 Tax=Micropterus salmoides TaxID=27706 RepID=UPI0018ED793C|nr:transmembrane protein 272-like [Micropterus salmoides]